MPIEFVENTRSVYPEYITEIRDKAGVFIGRASITPTNANHIHLDMNHNALMRTSPTAQFIKLKGDVYAGAFHYFKDPQTGCWNEDTASNRFRRMSNYSDASDTVMGKIRLVANELLNAFLAQHQKAIRVAGDRAHAEQMSAHAAKIENAKAELIKLQSQLDFLTAMPSEEIAAGRTGWVEAWEIQQRTMAVVPSIWEAHK